MWSLRVLVHLFLPMEAHSESCLDLWNEYSSYGHCFLAMKLGVTLFFSLKPVSLKYFMVNKICP